MADTKLGETPPYQTSTNPALYTNEKHEIYVAESRLLNPGPEQCVVHVRCNGICGSDVHFWKSGRIGDLSVNTDYVLGHEGAGVIEWVGDAVKGLRVGDRVAIEPGVPCHQCIQYSTGDYDLCPDVEFSGAPPYDGSIRRHHVHHAKYLHKIPNSLTFSDAALLEPWSVVLHAFERSPLRLGEPTVICGAGPIGLIALAAARASGAHPIIITDIDAGRLEFAEKFAPGCKSMQILPFHSPDAMGIAIVRRMEELGGEQPRVVFECTGVQSSIITACYSARRGGEVMVVGVGKPIMDQLPFMHVSLAEIDLKFINRYHHSWPFAIRLLSSGYLDLSGLVTHRFPLEKADEALATSADRLSGAIKVQITDGDV